MYRFHKVVCLGLGVPLWGKWKVSHSGMRVWAGVGLGSPAVCIGGGECPCGVLTRSGTWQV